jgi:hypothetical protein
VTALRPDLRQAPSPGLPLAYLVTAAAAFLLAAAGVVWLAHDLGGHYYHPRVLALAHTVALGWITLVMLGASYQLVPVVLERPLWSERLARWQLAVLAGGVAGMVGHFALGRWVGLPWAAGLVAAGLAGHLLNVTLTLRGLARWSFPARCVVGAHAGLGLTALFGLALAILRAAAVELPDPLATVHAHYHLALLGWVTPMVLGIAARVYPMFFLAPDDPGALGTVQLAGLGLGVPLVVAGLLGGAGLAPVGALLVTAALGAHLAWVVVTARRRKRPALDAPLRFVLTGAAFLVPAAALGVALATGVLAGPRAATACAVLALGGWISLTIVGMMLKIVPFLVWLRVYAPRAGRAAVPTLAQLGWPRAEALAHVALTAGTGALAAAVGAGSVPGIRLAGVILLVGAAAFAATLGRVLRHLGDRAGRALVPAPARAAVR